jgi:hypothetical protein
MGTKEYMMAANFQVTFDSANPTALAEFWIVVLGYKLQDPPPGFDSWEGWLRSVQIPEERWDEAAGIVDPEGVRPRLFFQKVPEGKTAKNRMHLDINVSGRRDMPLEEQRKVVYAKIDELTKLGATKLNEMNQFGQFWVVMQDPEGNEFCLS